MINKIRNRVDGDLHLKEILMKGGSSFFVKILGVLFSFLFTVMISRYYGASVYGSYSLCINFLLLASMFVMLGLDTTFLKFTAHYLELDQLNTVYDLLKKVLLVSVPVGIVLTILVYFTSDLIALHFFDKPNLGKYFKVASFWILPWSLTMILGAGLRGFKDVRTFTFLRDASTFFFGAIILYLLQIVYGMQELNPVNAYLLAIIVTLIIALVRFTRRIRSYESEDKVKEKIPYKKIFEIAFPLLIVLSSYYILALVNSVMLALFRTEADVGIYNVALKVSNITLIPLIAVNSIVGPKFAECFASKDYKAIGQVANASTNLIFLFSLPLIILCFAIPGPIMSFFGEEFSNHPSILRWLIAGQLINVGSGAVGILMQVTNLQKEFRNIIVVTTILVVLLNYIFIPIYGLTAAAITSMVNVALVNLSCVWVAKKKFDVLILFNPFRLRKNE